MADWTNSDGLEVRFNGPEAGPTGASVSTLGAVKNLVLDFDFATAITAAADGHEAFIPAGSYIKAATLIVTTAATSAGTATLSIGLAQKDGTMIGASSGTIDSAIALSAIDAVTEVVKCDGTLAGGTASIGAYNGYVYTTPTTGADVFTAGRGKLVIEYIEV
jgi:hypothetical protein